MQIAGLSGAQIVVQVAQPNGTFACSAYSGVATQRCAYIVIVGDTTLAAQLGSDLGHSLGPGVTMVDTPCDRQQNAGPLGCQALADPKCQKLLVLVSDGKNPIAVPSFAWMWKDSGDYSVLAVLPAAQRTSFRALIPSNYHDFNATYWMKDVTEAVPRVFSTAAITTDAPRVFISYRQKDSHAMAVQLFDALAHNGFDVFLDQYRVPPALNFQERLTQELGDKSMVVVLESKGILDSKWTEHEINTARACELTLVAIQPPDGRKVPGIDDAARRRLAVSDFVGGAFNEKAQLTDAKLHELVTWIAEEHDAGVLYRRGALRAAIENALTLRGVDAPSIDGTGMMQVKWNGQQYSIWASVRSPELNDFHVAHLAMAAPKYGAVIGLARLFELTTRRRFEWLSTVCNVAVIDKGEIGKAADAIVKGEALP